MFPPSLPGILVLDTSMLSLLYDLQFSTLRAFVYKLFEEAISTKLRRDDHVYIVVCYYRSFQCGLPTNLPMYFITYHLHG